MLREVVLLPWTTSDIDASLVVVVMLYGFLAIAPLVYCFSFRRNGQR